jgi:serine/threonine-protein kinase HipA
MPAKAPTFADSFGLLRRAATRPARDILKLLDAAIFNLIIGNADAHAKNFSLLHRDGAIVLAPLYDLLSTVAYPDLSPKLAMKIAGKATLDEIELRHWGVFAGKVGLAVPYVQRRVKELGEAVTLQVNLPESALWKRLPNDANFTAFADLIGGRSATVAGKT